MTLKDMKSRVDTFAARCRPDFLCTGDFTEKLRFERVPLDELTGIPDGEVVAGLAFSGEVNKKAIFNDWSKAQLFSHLGVREKWFSSVSIETEVEELSRRLETFAKHRLRLIQSIDAENLLIVRGFVSEHYADIPDTEIMKSALEAMPEAEVLTWYSGKTDRALYAYLLNTKEMMSLGALNGHPGIVLKNSEVGFTSLWVIPALYLIEADAPMVFEKGALLRRVHRGSVSDLTEYFKKALEKTSTFWGGLNEKLNALSSITYTNEDSAVFSMRDMLLRAGSSAGFAFRCERAYRGAAHTRHRAFEIFEAVLATVRDEKDQDTAHLSASVAGAVLLLLLK